MFQKPSITRLLSGLLVLVVLLPLLLSCKSAAEPPPEPLPSNPFTVDYKLNQTNAGFFTNTDGIEMLLSASPFYIAEQPLPSQKTEAYDNARAKKVDDIKQEAQSLVKTVIKLKPELDKLRGNYIAYLQAVTEADPKLRAFVTGIAVQVPSLVVQEAILENEYNSIGTDGPDNAYARSFMDYMKVVKAVELGGLYLQDIGNLAQYAALALAVLAPQDDAAVKKANEKLDKDMKALDGLRADAQAIAASMQKIDYGLKQLFTGSYYFTGAAYDFMAESLRDLEEAADKLTPRHGLTREDIQAIQTYLGLFERWQYQVKRQAETMDKLKLIKVTAWHEGKRGIAYAAEPMQNYASAVGALRGPLKVDTGNKKSEYFSTDWAATRKTIDIIAGSPTEQIRQLRQTIGVAVDATKLVEDALINATFGRYYFNIPASDIRDDIRKDWKAVQENFKNNMSGAGVLKAAGDNFKILEDAAGKTAATGARVIGVEDEWMVSAIGGAAKLTVGLYTGLVRDMYTLANQQSTSTETAQALLGMALSMTGGAKSVLSAPMMKSAEEKMAANVALAFVNSVIARQELETQALKAILRGAKAEADNLIRLHAAKEGIEKALRAHSQKLLAELERQGIPASFAGKTKEAGAESFRDLFRSDFDLSMAGIRDALKAVAGQNDWEYALNLLGSLGDEELRNALVKVMGQAAVNDLSPKAKMIASATRSGTPVTPKPSVTLPAQSPTPKPTSAPTPKPTTQVPPPTSPGVTTKPPTTTTPVPKPSATPALTAARNLTGTWKGRGVYYYVDIATSQRFKTLTVEVTLEIVQKDNTVTADMRKVIVKEEPAGEVKILGADRGGQNYSLGRFSKEETNVSLQGTASITTLNLTTLTTGYTDLWQFTFTTDLMSGGFRTQGRQNAPFEIRSDPKAFNLTRQK